MRTKSQERWLQWFNKTLYDRLAPAYGALEWLTLGAWWRLVRRALDYVPAQGRVLEVGFGPGKLHVALARTVQQAYGVDLGWGMCRLAQRRLERAHLPRRLARGSVYTLPYPDGAFDTTVSTFAFSGFRDAERAMQEMARVTAPGGRLVLVDIGLPRDGNRLGTFLARLWDRMGDFLYDLPGMMRSEGLDVVEFEEFGPGKHIRVMAAQKPGESQRLTV
jgi:ubiquinone/menaquinone biosynthesis C-methylase UbiE